MAAILKYSACAALLLALLALFPVPAQAQDYPRLSDYYLSAFPPGQNAVLVPQLARYDLLVLDMELSLTNPQALQAIRQLNPDITILAYMTSQQITSGPISAATQPLRYQLYNGIEPGWWLWTDADQHVSCWQDTWMLNCSAQCPNVNGDTWSSYFAGFITANVLSNPLWDGFFVDNCWSSVFWVDPGIDCDNDGSPDEPHWLDAQWQFGMEGLLDQLRQANPGKIFVGNGGYAYGQRLQGSMIEEWDDSVPDNGFGLPWAEFAWLQQELASTHLPPLFNLVAARQPANNQYNFKHMRFTLSAALLGSAYFGIDKGPEAHADTWWYDEYDVNLGQPLEQVNVLENEQIINGSFNSLAGWSTEVHAPLDPANNFQLGYEDGNSYAVCQINGTDGLDWHYALKQVNNASLVFENGERYAVSFRAKADRVRPLELVVTRNFGDYGWLMNAEIVYLSPQWRDYSFVITSQNAQNLPPSQLRFAFFLGQSDGTVCIDDVSLRHIDADHLLQRRFANGLALCNPTASAITASLEGTYYHLSGTQDPLVNNGQPCTSVTVPAYDGLILLSSPLQPLASPVVSIARIPSGIQLSWPAVPGAGAYRVEASSAPYGVFSVLGSTAATSFLDAAGVRRFYRVIAVP